MNSCQTIKLSLCIFLLSTFMEIPLRAGSYANQLHNGLKLSYRHWNSERQEFTGFTHQEFKQEEHQGQQAMLETQVNIKPDGEETRRKSLWYELPSGKPLEYLGRIYVRKYESSILIRARRLSPPSVKGIKPLNLRWS